MKFSGLSTTIFGALIFCLSGSANAGFIGKPISGQWYGPFQSTTAGSPFSAIVGPGVEFPTGSDIISGDSFDLGNTSILMTQTFGGFSAVPFNGVRFWDSSSTIEDIIGVTINVAGTSYPGFDSSRVSFDANNVWLNVQNLQEPGHVLLDVAFSNVPEPGTLTLLGLGLLGLTTARRRQLKA